VRPLDGRSIWISREVYSHDRGCFGSVIRIERLGLVAHVDGVVRREATGQAVEGKVGAPIDGHSKEHRFR